MHKILRALVKSWRAKIVEGHDYADIRLTDANQLEQALDEIDEIFRNAGLPEIEKEKSWKNECCK